MSRAVVVQQTGGPEVLRLGERPVGEPGPGQVRIALRAAGLNFIDVYFRTGLYPRPLPFVAGLEGAGVVEAVGPEVTELEAGDDVGNQVWIQVGRQDPIDRGRDGALVVGEGEVTDPMDLLGDVGEVEVCGECPHELNGPVEVLGGE